MLHPWKQPDLVEGDPARVHILQYYLFIDLLVCSLSFHLYPILFMTIEKTELENTHDNLPGLALLGTKLLVVSSSYFSVA